jgi:hypothetical protein
MAVKVIGKMPAWMRDEPIPSRHRKVPPVTELKKRRPKDGRYTTSYRQVERTLRRLARDIIGVDMHLHRVGRGLIKTASVQLPPACSTEKPQAAMTCSFAGAGISDE